MPMEFWYTARVTISTDLTEARKRLTAAKTATDLFLAERRGRNLSNVEAEEERRLMMAEFNASVCVTDLEISS